MKFSKILILLISCSCLSAMEEMNSIVIGPVVHTFIPRTRLTWTAQLDNGQIISASSCYDLQNVNVEERLKTRYMGIVGEKVMSEDEAEEWVKNLIKASIGAQKG